MPAHAERTLRNSSGFFGWLLYELEPKDGRGWAVVRIAAASAITVFIAMLFRIPEPTYMAYIVFLISRDEKVATFQIAAAGMAAVTLAILTILALSLIDLSEPAVRLPAMAAVTFLAMYGLRVFKLGPITYLSGFVVVLLQSVVDQVPSPEALTRLTLWTWVLVFVPVVTTATLTILFAPSVELLRAREFRRMVSAIAAAMRDGSVQLPLARFRERVVELLDKKVHVETGRARRTAVDTAVLRQLLNLLVVLEAVSPDRVARRGAAWAGKLDEILARASRSQPEETPESTRTTSIAGDPTEGAIASALDNLLHAFEEPDAIPVKAPGEQHLLVSDATTNPAHWQFALKTTFAVMIVYSIYTLLAWPGMRTSIVTCFFVALGSLGETVHKLTLRISGALLGGVTAGLCIVFIIPHFTDIGQLCLLVAAVSAIAGWIAMSSEQLAYAGLQMAFAFFLGVLQGYAPATDLAELRDRVAGILLGNIVITIVFSTLWPESAAKRVQASIGQLLRAIAALLQSPAEATANRERAARGLVLAEHFRTLRGFELQLVPGHASVEQIVQSVDALAMLEGRVFVSTFSPLSAGYRDADRQALAHWAGAAATAAETGVHWPAPPALAPGSSAAVDDVVIAARRAAQSAVDQEPV